jgi:hypothetical protein
MKDDQHQSLSLVGQAPARLNVEQVAWVLNCQLHDVPILVSSRLLKPLGNPAPNGIKFFSTAEVAEMTKDRAWLAKMTNTISQHWHKKNASVMPARIAILRMGRKMGFLALSIWRKWVAGAKIALPFELFLF